jgi:hypothetical protein
MDESYSELSEPKETIQFYYCVIIPRHKYTDLWSDENNAKRSWHLDELLAFICDLDFAWNIYDSGCWHEHTKGHPDRYFQFALSTEINGVESYMGGIKIDILRKCTRCRVSVSKQWIHSPLNGWQRNECPVIAHTGPSRPVHADSALYLVSRRIRRASTLIFLRGDPILRYKSRDVSTVLIYVVQYLTTRRNLGHICANEYMKAYLQFLSSVIKSPKVAPEKQTYRDFQDKIRGF